MPKEDTRIHYQCHQILILVKQSHRLTENTIIHSCKACDAVPFLCTNHDLVNRRTQLTAMSKIHHQTNNETANNAIPVKTTNTQTKAMKQHISNARWAHGEGQKHLGRSPCVELL